MLASPASGVTDPAAGDLALALGAEGAGEPGASAWIASSEQRTTLFFGATSINDCVCIEGTIKVDALNDDGSKSCTRCQEGLECPPGSLLADLLAGSAEVTSGIAPQLEPQQLSQESPHPKAMLVLGSCQAVCLFSNIRFPCGAVVVQSTALGNHQDATDYIALIPS